MLASMKRIVYPNRFIGTVDRDLHSLPSSRQTPLFSTTLSKLPTEFSKARLQEPSLIQLGVGSKVSQDLESAFLGLRVTKTRALHYISSKI